jgi:hypothetical protein
VNALLRRGFVILACGALPACGGPAWPAATQVLPGSAPSSDIAHKAAGYHFTTLDDPLAYSNFNELLGINNEAHIVGFDGSGSPSDPSQGYVIYPPYAKTNYHAVIYPTALDTEATAVNNKKTIAGFYTEKGPKTLGFTYTGGIWTSYRDPKAQGDGGVTELLGLNDSGIAVGFYQLGSASGSFELDITDNDFDGLNPRGGSDVIATGINGNGDIVGYLTESSGTVVGFLRKNGHYSYFSYPGSVSTEFLGVTIRDYIVGSYVDSRGVTHGFLLASPLSKNPTWQSIDDPDAVGPTVVTSINAHLDLVGYYVDSQGNTNGFLATPSSSK